MGFAISHKTKPSFVLKLDNVSLNFAYAQIFDTDV